MFSRAFLLAVLLLSPAWSQEPAAETPKPSAPSFDLRSDTMKKIVRTTAAMQFADVQVADKAPVESEPSAFKYVPPEEPVAPAREPPRQMPAKAQRSNGFLSAVFETLIDELLDVEEDDVTTSNEILRCRVQKELKTSPPGPDNCPNAD